ncbi:MAG: damage-inducible protein DinB [Bryobacterales bacterium]|nr:damage-inducible protein DinB [Bryobacterales bacterium]
MRYHFLLDTYETERIKVVSVWGSFRDVDLSTRPHPTDTRGRSVLEQMIHQCISEDHWFKTFFGIDVIASPLPDAHSRRSFIERYWEDSGRRLSALQNQDDGFWEEEVAFFDTPRSRAWIMVRRVAHTAHHRGQQMAMLRMLNRELHSNYGPTADTGDQVVYAYPDFETLLQKLGDSL